MWTADSDAQHPNPYVKVVRINENDMTLAEEPDIWSSAITFAYADACPNNRGHLGITLFAGNADWAPSHVVGIRDDDSDQQWDLRFTRIGTNGPGDGKWGDYLSCRQHSPDGLTWIASGFTLQGGSSWTDVEPRIVHFGREKFRGAVDRWSQS